jgi:hypothetical protein
MRSCFNGVPNFVPLSRWPESSSEGKRGYPAYRMFGRAPFRRSGIREGRIRRITHSFGCRQCGHLRPVRPKSINRRILLGRELAVANTSTMDSDYGAHLGLSTFSTGIIMFRRIRPGKLSGPMEQYCPECIRGAFPWHEFSRFKSVYMGVINRYTRAFLMN